MNRKLRLLTDIGAAAGIAAMIAALYAVFIYAPEEAIQGLPQKIFYFHLPIAILAFVMFFVGFVGSAGYLVKKTKVWDIYASSAIEVGLMLTTLIMITGMLWGKAIWGAYWTWDPKLTTALILWLIYAGYMILRSSIHDEYQRAKLSAVLGVVGFLDVPVVHYSVRLWGRGIHPIVIKSADNPGMTPEMLTALRVSFLAFIILVGMLYFFLVRINLAEDKLNSLKAGS